MHDSRWVSALDAPRQEGTPMSQTPAAASAVPPLSVSPQPGDPQHQAQGPSFTIADGFFCLFMVFMFGTVCWLGLFTRGEALKTESAKQNGEAWVAWLKAASEDRFKPGYQYSACAGQGPAEPGPGIQVVPSASADAASAATASSPPPAPAAKSTWGGCLEEMMAKTELGKLSNPFLGGLPKLVTECTAADRSLVGAIDLDKIMSTPAGSAVPTVKSDLVKDDSISEKIKIVVTVCDKGAYPIKINEIEF